MNAPLADPVDALRGQPVLVTGASGFIGAHLTRRLVALGADVHVLLRPESSSSKLDPLGDRIRILRADLGDAVALPATIAEIRPRYAFHMAAYTNVGRDRDNDERAIMVNLVGTVRLLNALADAGVQRIVNSGSCEEYGDRDVPAAEADALHPVSPYSVSKAAATMWCEMVHRTRGIPVTTIRPFLCYGPEQEAVRLIPQAILAALANREFPMTLGEQTREFTHIDDIVEGYLRAAVVPGVEGEVFNLSSGEETSVRNAVDLIFRLADSKGHALFGALPYRQAELWRSCGDATRARAMLDWNPVVKFADGIAAVIPWYRDALQSGALTSPPT
ncbi:MAG: SDR family NAD(P)-dependent oxidoreductase [Gammaproteobacteria bacterium]|jgi:nucleoside-diphosphate-sugar epimerase|nr:SDR family NAD(P)-dependent oxidoreductase [Gammaproteobacteria bacterium]MBU0772761.1 SDR family NAD(P)-dependent oxidoreductase [Gammaproteobacteria bacterium]MBU0855689.1 SDR family NAD(P)-dependent oxidoreductase [Gammaproteobacteria bacterium]MBU1847042.1 SDR family NAD(P)-dependent oxidoreductase [Gammaproteobacteria bacterium]